MKEFMKMSAKFMQNEPYKLTPEQAQKYADASMEEMAGVKSMRMPSDVAVEVRPSPFVASTVI